MAPPASSYDLRPISCKERYFLVKLSVVRSLPWAKISEIINQKRWRKTQSLLILD
jgi:hypothetical protein